MVSNLSDFLIKPQSKEEENYCKKHNIYLIRLENGITIVGIHCKKDATAGARIVWEFPVGSYGSPNGAVHFLEHFVNKSIRSIAERNALNIHAFTNPIRMGEEVIGVTNPEHKDYGVWTVLEKIRKSLESPLNTVENIDKEIESEKKIIKSEIGKVKANHDSHVDNHFRIMAYPSTHPYYNRFATLGDENDIEKISEKILREAEQNILVPDEFTIGFYTEGDKEILYALGDELEKQYSNFPRAGVKNKKVSKDALETINPDFKPGLTHSYNTELKNGLVTTEFVWQLDCPFPSNKYFALRHLAPTISTDLFMYARKMGWGYFTKAYQEGPTDQVRMLTLRIDSRKDDHKDFLSGIKEVLSNVKNSTEEICDLENKKQKAMPISIGDRLSWIIGGLKDYGAIINVDKIREKMMVQPKDLESVIEEILSKEPVILATGDLS